MSNIAEIGKRCSGCRGCEQACAVGAIRFVADAEGFMQPVVDADKCIDCGRIIGNKNKRCESCYKKYKSKGYADIISENKETIYSMAQKGCSVKEIADYFNMAPQSFSRICRRLGIKYKI